MACRYWIRHIRLEFRAILVVILTCLFVASSVWAEMNIIQIEIETHVDREDGIPPSLPVCLPYQFSIEVQGEGIKSVTVRTPSLLPQNDAWPLFPHGPTEWEWSRFCFLNLDDIRGDADIGFGNFEFMFEGDLGEIDGVAVPYDPGLVDPITVFGDVTTPMHLDTDVSLDPIFEWTCTADCVSVPCTPDCDSIHWFLGVLTRPKSWTSPLV